MQASTIISSSHSLNSAATSAAKHTTSGGGDAGLFEPSYRNPNVPLMRRVDQILQSPAEKIAKRVLSDTADGKSASVVIMLADQADVSAAHDMKDQDARGWFVYNTLTQHAARTQVVSRRFSNRKA